MFWPLEYFSKYLKPYVFNRFKLEEFLYISSLFSCIRASIEKMKWSFVTTRTLLIAVILSKAFIEEEFKCFVIFVPVDRD